MGKITTSFEDFDVNEEDKFIDKVTYEMSGSPRPYWATKAEFVSDMQNWGYSHTTLNRNTDMLIVADEDLGTLKCQKAEKYGIPVYTYDQAFKKKELLYTKVIRKKRIMNLNKKSQED